MLCQSPLACQPGDLLILVCLEGRTFSETIQWLLGFKLEKAHPEWRRCQRSISLIKNSLHSLIFVRWNHDFERVCYEYVNLERALQHVPELSKFDATSFLVNEGGKCLLTSSSCSMPTMFSWFSSEPPQPICEQTNSTVQHDDECWVWRGTAQAATVKWQQQNGFCKNVPKKRHQSTHVQSRTQCHVLAVHDIVVRTCIISLSLYCMIMIMSFSCRPAPLGAPAPDPAQTSSPVRIHGAGRGGRLVLDRAHIIL